MTTFTTIIVQGEAGARLATYQEGSRRLTVEGRYDPLSREHPRIPGKLQTYYVIPWERLSPVLRDQIAQRKAADFKMTYQAAYNALALSGLQINTEDVQLITHQTIDEHGEIHDESDTIPF